MQAQRQNQTAQETTGDVVSFRLIEEIQRLGINVADIKKLQDAGYTTVGSNVLRSQ